LLNGSDDRLSMKPGSLRIIVTGLIGQHPVLGGMTWHYLHYVLGLRQLGHDVYYVEDSGEWPYNLHGGPSGDNFQPDDCVDNVTFLRTVMSRFGLQDRWAYRCPISGEWHGGVPPKNADLLLNVSGTLANPEEYRQVATLAYIDTDPVFTQIKLARGDQAFRRLVHAHDIHFSFGESLGSPVPLTGYNWIPTRQPVMLSEWRRTPRCRNVFTTVMNWASYGCETWNSYKYGQKDIEFARFVDLATAVSPIELEVAVRGTRKGVLPGFAHVRAPGELHAFLRAKRWRVIDATSACGDFLSYRVHIERSKGEWTIAKNAYVAARSGWFSDRSACYLAAGRPVVTQHTGFNAVIPTGRGLLAFSDFDEAADAIREVDATYDKHAAAAQEIAAEYFSSNKVLPRLIELSLCRSHKEAHV
jgi:hypothetical protein